MPLAFSGSLSGSIGIVGPLLGTSVSSSYPFSVTGSTVYSTYVLAGPGLNSTNTVAIGTTAGYLTSGANDSIFIGEGVGSYATFAAYSNFLGYYSGQNAVSSSYANFIGYNAGNGATVAQQSNFIGRQAGQNAADAGNSNFIGTSAGQNATNALQSNFIGQAAGQGATYASVSNFVGYFAGDQALYAEQSNFVGRSAGQGAVSASYSNLIGWQAGKKVSGAGIGANNIIIGTNITLENDRRDSINLGGVIFATGSYAYDPFSSDPYSGSMTLAKVGINNSLPQYTLDVSGSGNFEMDLIVSGTLAAPFSMVIPTAINIAPAPPTGSMYFNAGLNTLNIYNGTTWVSASFS